LKNGFSFYKEGGIAVPSMSSPRFNKAGKKKRRRLSHRDTKSSTTIRDHRTKDYLTGGNEVCLAFLYKAREIIKISRVQTALGVKSAFLCLPAGPDVEIGQKGNKKKIDWRFKKCAQTASFSFSAFQGGGEKGQRRTDGGQVC